MEEVAKSLEVDLTIKERMNIISSAIDNIDFGDFDYREKESDKLTKICSNIDPRVIFVKAAYKYSEPAIWFHLVVDDIILIVLFEDYEGLPIHIWSCKRQIDTNGKMIDSYSLSHHPDNTHKYKSYDAILNFTRRSKKFIDPTIIERTNADGQTISPVEIHKHTNIMDIDSTTIDSVINKCAELIITVKNDVSDPNAFTEMVDIIEWYFPL